MHLAAARQSLFPPQSFVHPTFLTSPDPCDVITCSLPEPDTQHNSTYARVHIHTRERFHLQKQRRALVFSSSVVQAGQRRTDKRVPLRALSSATSAPLTSASDADLIPPAGPQLEPERYR